MKKTIVSLILILVITAMSVITVNADSNYRHGFNQTYEYDDMPTLKIEAYFDDSPELSWMLKTKYESLMSAIPEHLRMMMKNADIVVYLTRDVYDYYNKGDDPGIMMSGFVDDKTLGLYVNLSYDPEYDSYDYCVYKIGCSLYALAGLALDALYGQPSRQKDFLELFAEEDKNYISASDPSALFSDLFFYYMFDYKDGVAHNSYGKYVFTKSCPKCGAYMMELFGLDNIYEPYIKINAVKIGIEACANMISQLSGI